MNNTLLFVAILWAPCLMGQEVQVIDEKVDRIAASTEYEKGRSYLESGENRLALDRFTKAIELFPYDANYYFGQAKAYSGLALYTEAFGSISEAMEQSPGQVDFENTAGTICFRLKKYEEAIQYFSTALNPTEINKGDIDRANVFYNRGISYLMLGQYALAEHDFGEAITRNNAFVQAYHNRGVALNRQHKYKEACKDFLKAVELGNESSFNYVKADCK